MARVNFLQQSNAHLVDVSFYKTTNKPIIKFEVHMLKLSCVTVIENLVNSEVCVLWNPNVATFSKELKTS